jgi:signal peptidase
MEPAFHRGDWIFFSNHEEQIRVGEIVVFEIKGRDIPIVHRVISVHERENGTARFLTKGDKNESDDRQFYAPGQAWLLRDDVIGQVKGLIPYCGMPFLIFNEYPIFRYLLLGLVLIHETKLSNSLW